MSIIKGKNIIVGSSSPHWGSINGSLDDQTDLKNILDSKADSNSPTFVGIPHVPTAINGTNNTQIANTEFVNEAIKELATLPLFTPIWYGYIINDASYLLANPFSWHSSEIYISAYNHLEDDYKSIEVDSDNNKISKTEIIEDIEITYYEASDSHKICLSDQMNNIQNLYEKIGYADYFILDIENKQFKLPRNKKTSSDENLYFYVGNTAKSELKVDVGELTEQLNSLSGSVYTKPEVDKLIEDIEVAIDNESITLNDNSEIQTIGVIEQNKNKPIYDWVGTKAEYDAQNIQENHPEWLCYITDDNEQISTYDSNTIDRMFDETVDIKNNQNIGGIKNFTDGITVNGEHIVALTITYWGD